MLNYRAGMAEVGHVVRGGLVDISIGEGMLACYGVLHSRRIGKCCVAKRT